MKTSKAREQILGRIRKGLSTGSFPMPFPEVDKEDISSFYEKNNLSPEEQFATEFIKLGGKFVFCDTEKDLLDAIHRLYDNQGWTELLCAEERVLDLCQNNRLEFVHPADAANETADACITGCELLVARTGSTLLTSKQNLGRIAPVFYPVHIIVAYMNQIVADLPEALAFLKAKYGNELPSMINLNTGPSRTADIEKTLVVGVHGPGEVYCFLVNR
ncbi:MAG TPA: lactate utilization protein [Flavipsychrobacter sp.]|nr:lactate utilization protein [Flavipsychrobacter sp.]